MEYATLQFRLGETACENARKKIRRKNNDHAARLAKKPIGRFSRFAPRLHSGMISEHKYNSKEHGGGQGGNQETARCKRDNNICVHIID